MRILQLHSDFIEYEPVKKEIAQAEECEKKKYKLEEVVVLFTAVESGDNEQVAKNAIDEIKSSLEEIKVNKILIYPFSHLSSDLAKPNDALKVIKEMEVYAKKINIETYRAPFGWNKQFSIKIKGHPLAEQSKVFKPSEKPKVKVVEWETPKPEFLILTLDGKTIDPKDYKFKKDEEELKLLVDKEAFKKESKGGGEPKYIEFIKRFGFEWEPKSDSGHMRYGPKAALMVDLVGDYAWRITQELKIPSFNIKGTNLFNVDLPEIREHADLFGERLYSLKVDKKEFILKYAACFQQFSLVKDWNISYKQIPFGMFEIADSYRQEQSGECLLGFRLKRFFMPDYHIFCKDLNQSKELALKVHEKIYGKIRELGIEYVSLYNLTKSFFDGNKKFLNDLLKTEKKPVLLHFVPENKFYWTINVEYHIIDELKRPREIATFQIDIGNAKRFGIKYVDENTKEVNPPIIHTATLGGIERYIFAVFNTVLREKNPTLPLWLSPIQARVIPLSDKFLEDAEKIAEKIGKNMIRVDVDDRDDTVSKKIRDAELEWIPFSIVIGEKEIKSKELPVRIRETGKIKQMEIEDLVKIIKKETQDKPFRQLPLPKLVSKRPIW
jgi:threonyl-tRNA synthetase